jgi:hypothetical protein
VFLYIGKEKKKKKKSNTENSKSFPSRTAGGGVLGGLQMEQEGRFSRKKSENPLKWTGEVGSCLFILNIIFFDRIVML